MSLEENSTGVKSDSRSGSGVVSFSPFYPTALAGKRSAGIPSRQNIRFEDLVPVAILGIGGFGRVELVSFNTTALH